jgi:hypothetical protein
MNALIVALIVATQPALSDPPMPVAQYPAPAPVTGDARQPVAEVAAPGLELVREPRNNGVSIQLAAHLGLLTVDAQVGRFYAFAAGNIGIPLLTNGTVGAITAGMGPSFLLRKTGEVAWHLDILALGNFMWLGQQPMGGFGVGMGFRMVHASGFTMAFKIPALGGEMGTGYGGTQIAVAYWFLAQAISLPVFSVGYRF